LNLQEIEYIQKIENLNRLPLDGEEGGEGELDAPRKRNGERKARAMLTVDETRDGGGRPDNDGIRTRRRRGFGQRRQRGWDGARRGGSDSSGGAVGTGPIETALHCRDAGAARGSHAAMACCQAGPARTAASDRWDPLVSVF
jgi:hypothetical protein